MTNKQARDARLKAAIIREYGPFGWRRYKTLSAQLARELAPVIEERAAEVGDLVVCEQLVVMVFDLVVANPDDGILRLTFTNALADVLDLLTGPQTPAAQVELKKAA